MLERVNTDDVVKGPAIEVFDEDIACKLVTASFRAQREQWIYIGDFEHREEVPQKACLSAADIQHRAAVWTNFHQYIRTNFVAAVLVEYYRVFHFKAFGSEIVVYDIGTPIAVDGCHRTD
jgi:hypothetical protein